MHAVVTPAEMVDIDAAAPEPVETLIERAGAAVAWAARRRLGGTYGKRVVVLAGKGNNGADGGVAARRLRDWGIAVTEIDAHNAPLELPACDLVIDAVVGTGSRRPYVAPRTSSPVLAVDIPSGVDGQTGAVWGSPLTAIETVTFQALKPGLLFAPGRQFAGTLSVVDIGLDTSSALCHRVDASAVAQWLPAKPFDVHKWRSATWMIGGSAAMRGAPRLAASAAARAGAGYVRLSVPGLSGSDPIEAVHHALPAEGWERGISTDLDRFHSLVVGPGLGRNNAASTSVRALAAAADIPLVLDGDAIAALEGHLDIVAGRSAPTVLTPHDGEYERLAGQRPGPDRIDAARNLAMTLRAVVLLKGPATVVADAEGECLIVDEGDQRLATAGTGDVLAGVIGALLARGMGPFHAAAAGAWLHARSAQHSPAHGMIASDLLANLPKALDETDLG